MLNYDPSLSIELRKIRQEMEIANQLKAMEVYQRIYGVYANTPEDIKEQINENLRNIMKRKNSL